MLNTMRKATLHQANKLLVTTRSKTKAEGAALPPVHGVQKHLDPAVKPEHDKPVTDQNKQKGPTSTDLHDPGSCNCAAFMSYTCIISRKPK